MVPAPTTITGAFKSKQGDAMDFSLSYQGIDLLVEALNHEHLPHFSTDDNIAQYSPLKPFQLDSKHPQQKHLLTPPPFIEDQNTQTNVNVKTHDPLPGLPLSYPASNFKSHSNNAANAGSGGAFRWGNAANNQSNNNTVNDIFGGLGGEGGADDDDEEEEEEFVEDSGSSSGSSESSAVSWIYWYCSLPGHEFFIEVPEDFIKDDFNLTGLNTLVLLYNEALDMILDLELDPQPTPAQLSLIESSAEMLYGLIHQRFLLTKGGLGLMADRLAEAEFGACPREGCGGAPVLPCGRSDQPSVDTVKMYCVRCCDLYHPREAKFQNIDGAFFGTTFPHLLYNTYPHLSPPVITPSSRTTPTTANPSSTDAEDPQPNQLPRLPNYRIYVPRVFGFKLSERAVTGPRMGWLRWKEGVDCGAGDGVVAKSMEIVSVSLFITVAVAFPAPVRVRRNNSSGTGNYYTPSPSPSQTFNAASSYTAPPIPASSTSFATSSSYIPASSEYTETEGFKRRDGTPTPTPTRSHHHTGTWTRAASSTSPYIPSISHTVGKRDDDERRTRTPHGTWTRTPTPSLPYVPPTISTTRSSHDDDSTRTSLAFTHATATGTFAASSSPHAATTVVPSSGIASSTASFPSSATASSVGQSVTTSSTASKADSSPPISDVDGPCQQDWPNSAICKPGLICVRPTDALIGAAGTCQNIP
ncbi:UNVERIFIED_CONTAM: casein kinase 2 regulatory subunit [Siphonaria sp. JEL0065]|nr:casein kinase 2 regulatory subunit [Siphonaria sp. JEL0065]